MANGTFARIRDILKSNMSELFDRAADTEKMIRQSVGSPVYRSTSIGRASMQNQIKNTQGMTRMTGISVGAHAPALPSRAVRPTRSLFLPCKLVWSRQDAR